MSDPQDNGAPSVVFLGGLFLPERIDEIQRRSRGPVQFAADALQKAFLRGFATASEAPLSVVNLPFVGSYPERYRALRFPAWSGTYPAGVRVQGRPFLNLHIVKYLSRFRSALAGLKAAIPPEARATVVVYSAHLPFLAAARMLQWSRPSIDLCLILPDLPEFMGTGGRVYFFLKSIETFLFRKIIAHVNCFVLLTDVMGDRLGIPPARRVVVEGIFDPVDHEYDAGTPSELPADEFPILYTGTIAARYGISDLLDAFERLERPEARLWICGDGDTRPCLEALAARDARVTYFGQVNRSQALKLQRQAAVLVNPRRAEGEFTQYSFPSKTMEYLASGKPVVMHALPGVPKEYHDYLIIPPTQDAAGLAEVLDDLAGRTAEDRLELGQRGQLFVLNDKNPEKQVGKVIARLRALENHPRECLTRPSKDRGRNRRALVICNSSETGTFFNLMSTLSNALAVNNSAELLVQKDFGGNRICRVGHLLAREFKRLPKLLWCDTVVFHSVLWVQLPSVVLSYLLRRRIVVVHWDIYPVTVDGKLLDGSSSKIFERLERFLGRISTRIIIPSEDFTPFLQHPNLRIMPLWPSVPLGRMNGRAVPAEGQPVRLAFVGQAGLTRGLPQAVARLGRETSVRFELHVFSPKPPEDGLSYIAANLKVVPRGYLGRTELLAALDDMDFGLISLHPGMGQPGFPSKTFDYVAAGLPVIYTGRPLPAFVALLERTGVGFALNDAAVDWTATMQSIRLGMPDAVQAFAAETELDPETLDRMVF